MIINSTEQFCDELGENLLLIGEELKPSDVVDDRIDILAIDKDGATIVIELKRGASKLQLLQSLSYAAMVSQWDHEMVVKARARLRGITDGDAQEEIEEFLTEDIGVLNQRQRVFLFAEEYDYQVLVTSKWLNEIHDVDIACWQIELADDVGAEYLSLRCVYPPPELADAARTRRTGGTTGNARWADWDEALAAVTNSSVIKFYRSRLAENYPSRLHRRVLLFAINGRNRFWMSARKRHAYVWQRGRFHGDTAYWRDRLGVSARIDPVADGRALRLFLDTDPQFDAFFGAVSHDMLAQIFTHEPPQELDVVVADEPE